MADILPFAQAARLQSDSPAPGPMPDVPEGAPDGERWGAWMVLAQDGDRVAYHALLKSITPYLRAITRRYLGRGEDAEDAVQDVLMIVHGIRHTYERGRPFKPWLNTLASRRCIDLLRRRAHRLQHETVSEDQVDAAVQGTDSPEQAAARQHAAGELRGAVDALPERQREAIRLLRLNELSLEEAAAQSDQSIGSLKVACHRAIKSLQRALAKKDITHD